MSSTATVHSSQEIHHRAEQLAGALETAANAAARATKIAEELYQEIEREQPLERLNFEALMCAKGIAIDLGVDTGDGLGEFDLKRNASEAAALVDLIRLGSDAAEVKERDARKARQYAELDALGLFLSLVAEEVQDVLEENAWDNLVVTSGPPRERDSMTAFAVALHGRNPSDDSPEMEAIDDLSSRIEAQLCARTLTGAVRDAIAARIGRLVQGGKQYA
jgi:hypothetical protein